jgi:hypothetical protein
VQVIEFFLRVETLISFAKFLASMYFHEEWCTSQYMGRKFSPEIWAETLNFRPRKFHSLTQEIPGGGAEIPPQGQNFRPQWLAYKSRGSGWRYPLASSSTPDPLSPNHRRPLIKLLSGDSLATGISGSRRPALSSTWGVTSSASFSPWMTVLSQISHPRCPCLVLD